MLNCSPYSKEICSVLVLNDYYSSQFGEQNLLCGNHDQMLCYAIQTKLNNNAARVISHAVYYREPLGKPKIHLSQKDNIALNSTVMWV